MLKTVRLNSPPFIKLKSDLNQKCPYSDYNKQQTLCQVCFISKNSELGFKGVYCRANLTKIVIIGTIIVTKKPLLQEGSPPIPYFCIRYLSDLGLIFRISAAFFCTPPAVLIAFKIIVFSKSATAFSRFKLSTPNS